MTNHSHMALETPRGNLAEGMQCLQGTFSRRFNAFRKESGHLFQGRYKSLIVEPSGLGALSHYIHLNPVRAGLRTVEALGEWPWSSMYWLLNPRKRPAWYQAEDALTHAGALDESPKSRKKVPRISGVVE